jgi:hypothetical protein
MSSGKTRRFEVIVNGRRSGAVDRWKHISLTVDSLWDVGSDGEKFAVLTAIRRTYDPDSRADIRGNEGQTPAQVGRCEGFRELGYRHSSESSRQVVIVPPMMQYLRLVPPAADSEYALTMAAPG